MQRFSVRDWEERAGGQPDRAWDGWAPWEAALGWTGPLGWKLLSLTHRLAPGRQSCDHALRLKCQRTVIF